MFMKTGHLFFVSHHLYEKEQLRSKVGESLSKQFMRAGSQARTRQVCPRLAPRCEADRNLSVPRFGQWEYDVRER